jgi:hypothetical protein
VDRDLVLATFEREGLEAAQRVREDRDPALGQVGDRLALPLELRPHPLPLRLGPNDLEEAAGHRVLDPRGRDVDPRGRLDLVERGEPDVGARPRRLEHDGPVDAAHARGERLDPARGDDLVPDLEAALVDDDVPHRSDPLLIAPLQDRALAAPIAADEVLLKEPLGEPDQERDQLGDPDPGLRGDRHDPHVVREVAHPIVAVRAEAEPHDLFGDGVDPGVEGPQELVAALLQLLREREASGRLPPTGEEVDLRERDHERRLLMPEDLDRLPRLRHHPFARVDHEHRQVRERAAAPPQGLERPMPGRVDEQETGYDPLIGPQDPFAEDPDHLARDLDRADVLRDPARFLRGAHAARDAVQQRRLPVVHVTQQGDDRFAQVGHRRLVEAPSLTLSGRSAPSGRPLRSGPSVGGPPPREARGSPGSPLRSRIRPVG